MLLYFPLPRPRLQNRIRSGRLVNHVADPRVPARLDLAGFELLVFVIDPARAQRELLREVLVVFITVAVRCDEGAGFGVAHVLHLVAIFLEQLTVSNWREWGVMQGRTLKPIRRRFRRVRRIVDILSLWFKGGRG